MSSWSSVPEPDSADEHAGLVRAARVLRERWWLVILCFVLCTAITTALAMNSVKQYTATSTLLVQPSNLPALIDPSQAQATDSATLQLMQADDVSLVSSGPVAAIAKQLLHSSASMSDLVDEVVATPEANNDLIDVSVTDPDPARAAAAANAFATALVRYLNASAQAQLISGQANLQAELAHLAPGNPGQAPLAQALKQVIALRAVTNGGVQVVDTASVPTSPSSASVKRDAAIGGVVGIVLGLVLIFMLDLFDRRIKTTKELERLYGMSALVSVPLRRRRGSSERALQTDLEPFRILRDALSYVSLRKETRVVLVTSAVAGEGKTRVASGLAEAIAAANKLVALIEVDVHRPTLKGQFGLASNGRGLMNVLVDGSSPLDLMQIVPARHSLSVLPCGPFTPNSAELLRLPAMANALGELAHEFELVILDGPPLLPVADAQVLLDNSLIDAVLIVCRPYVTTRDQVRSALAVLKRHPTKGIGLVINAARDSHGGYYYPGTSGAGAPASKRRKRSLVAGESDEGE